MLKIYFALTALLPAVALASPMTYEIKVASPCFQPNVDPREFKTLFQRFDNWDEANGYFERLKEVLARNYCRPEPSCTAEVHGRVFPALKSDPAPNGYSTRVVWVNCVQKTPCQVTEAEYYAYYGSLGGGYGPTRPTGPLIPARCQPRYP